MADTTDKINVKSNENAIDFLLSILFSAISSYRHDSLVKPFPPGFSNNEELLACFEALYFPSFKCPQQHFTSWIQSKSDRILITPANNNVLRAEFGEQLNSVTVPKPHYVVKLQSRQSRDVFQSLSKQHGVIQVFHGTHTENVFSIINNGLIGNLNKRGLFGEGTYLSSDIGVALSFSKSGKSWSRSQLGQNMMCVLVCDVVDNDEVKRGISKLSGISLNTASIPHNYFVVQNDDLVRVTHVLVYVSKAKRTDGTYKNCFVQFLKSYGFILFYILILFCACLKSSKFVNKWFIDI